MFTVRDQIEKDVITISTTHTIREAMEAMESMMLHQIVVINDIVAVGILHWEDIYEIENKSQVISTNNIRDKNVGINGAMHLFEAARLIADNGWEVLPVLDASMNYEGCLRWDSVFAQISNMLAMNLSGSMLVLRRLSIDYSLAEIARICESNECRVISSGIMQEDGTNALIVTLKLDKYEIGGVIAAFERYEYEVIASFGDNEYKDFLKDRYDSLMNYLNV